MSIIINKPVSWINRDKAKGGYWHHDIDELYTRLERLVKDFKVPGRVYINHHSIGGKNTWHIKKGYVPGYLYFDKYGYSGWSELAKKYDGNLIFPNEKEDIISICQYYINNNVSKAAQPAISDEPDKPYILVTGQQATDTVARLSYIDTNTLPKLVKKAYKNTKYNIVFKPHPLDKTRYSNYVKGSIHDLIPNAEAVYTVNSGTGFEALMHGKRVFTTGDCDYKWATTQLKTEQDIIDSIDLIEEPIDLDYIISFLHYCFNYHFVHAYSDESIIRKLQRVVKEYES
jgi:hypothetical protein